MGFLSSLTSYAGKWNAVGRTKLTTEEIKSVESAEVVESLYGKSVKFTMVGGGLKFLPISNNTACNIGDNVDLTKLDIVQLHRDGESDIYRAEF